MLRVNSFPFLPFNGAFGAHSSAYTPVDLDTFLQTGDVFQAAGLQQGLAQDQLQMMQAQLLMGLLMQLDPAMLVQLAMMSMLSGRMNGGAGINRGHMGGGGFSRGRSVPGGGWTANRSHGHSEAHATGGPRSSGERGIPNGLRANAANGARVVRQMGFTGTIGGLGHRSGKSDHPHGNAIDVMTHGDVRMGRQVAEHFRQNHEELGVKYVIYQQQIASPRTGWQWRPMEDRGSPTANHMDHPHISFH